MPGYMQISTDCGLFCILSGGDVAIKRSNCIPFGEIHPTCRPSTRGGGARDS